MTTLTSSDSIALCISLPVVPRTPSVQVDSVELFVSVGTKQLTPFCVGFSSCAPGRSIHLATAINSPSKLP